MTIRIVKEPEGSGPPYERCCFCWRPTTYWHAKKDVAVCPECASTHATPDIPKKQDWCKQTAGLDQMTTPQTTPTRDEAVPTDWKLVPVEPTPKMLQDAAFNLSDEFGADFVRPLGDFARALWAELLASAPAPASGGVDQQALNAARKIYNESLNLDVGALGATERIIRAYFAALSQSTSAGRERHGPV